MRLVRYFEYILGRDENEKLVELTMVVGYYSYVA